METYKKKGYKKSKFVNLYSVVREVLNEKVYEHSIYEGLDEDKLRVLTEKINIAPAYQRFLKEVNGFDLYEGKISLFGLFQLKKGMSRVEMLF